MKQQPEQEVKREDIAYLEDRIRIREGRSQIYGTQFKKEEEGWVLFPIENPEKVDELRKEFGMESLEEYKQFFFKHRKDDKQK